MGKFLLTCQNHNEPIEKYLNEICEKEICLSTILHYHCNMSYVNSIAWYSTFLS